MGVRGVLVRGIAVAMAIMAGVLLASNGMGFRIARLPHSRDASLLQFEDSSLMDTSSVPYQMEQQRQLSMDKVGEAFSSLSNALSVLAEDRLERSAQRNKSTTRIEVKVDMPTERPHHRERAADHLIKEANALFQEFEPESPPVKKIVSFRMLHNCLNPDNSLGGVIKLYSCKMGSPIAQSWTFDNETNTISLRILDGRNRYLRHDCLEDKGNGYLNYGPCNPDAAGQIWELVEPHRAGTPYGTQIRNVVTQQCVGLAGQHPRMERCADECGQRWIFTFLNGVESKNWLGAVAPTRDLSAELGVKHIRIVCWIQTQPSAHKTKVTSINATWGRECDEIIYASSELFEGYNVVITDSGMKESRWTLWVKTMQAWMHVFENYLDKGDWFFKADDDCYANMHFIREMVKNIDPDIPMSLGRRLQLGGTPGKYHEFLSGGPGQLVSRGAVRRMSDRVQEAFNNWELPLVSPSDLQTSRTLFKVGVPVVSSLDSQLRNRFIVLGLDMEHTLRREAYKNLRIPFWLFTYSDDTRELHDCCSERWVGTHYVQHTEMYAIYNQHHVQCRNPLLEYPYLDFHAKPTDDVVTMETVNQSYASLQAYLDAKKLTTRAPPAQNSSQAVETTQPAMMVSTPAVTGASEGRKGGAVDGKPAAAKDNGVAAAAATDKGVADSKPAANGAADSKTAAAKDDHGAAHTRS
eukprot:m.83154 g.83154  ORF g.83154 m.83154 type:complete len:693 (-) comp8152_c0_seq3:323-2401(-)